MTSTFTFLRSARVFVLALSSALSFGPFAVVAQTSSTSTAPLPHPTTNPVKVNPALTNPATTRHVNVERPPANFAPQGVNRLSTAQRAALSNSKPTVKQLPAFALTDRDGKSVVSTSLTRNTHWLLLYRTETCLPCDRLMNVLAASSSPNLSNGLPYTVIVDGKTAVAGETVRAKFAKLNSAIWLTDSKKQLVTSLKPRGTPMLYGMNGNNIVWSSPGTLGDPDRVEKLSSSWLAAAPAASAAKASNPTASAVAGSGSSTKQ